MNEANGADYLAEAAACGAEGHEPCDVLAAEFERVMLDNPNAEVRTADAQVVVTLMSEGETPEWLFGPLMAR